MTIALASQIIGFISFSITLITLLGVYADLLKTLRSSPTTIPLTLGNLREEIQYEQLYLRFKLQCGDDCNVFPDSRLPKQRRKNHDFVRLVEQTLRHVWREFCDLERPFIMNGEKPWSLDDVDLGMEFDEKLTNSRRRGTPGRSSRRESFVKNRMGVIEAGLSSDRATYYNTDLSHRLLWWWKKDDIQVLANQVQRLQIRRIERDVYESDELVKRSFKHQCRRYGWDYRASYSNDSDDNSEHGGGTGGSDDEGNQYRGRRRKTNAGRRRSWRRSKTESSPARNVKEISEREIIRRPARDPGRTDTRRSTAKNLDRERRSRVVYEYEVINPGPIDVESQPGVQYRRSSQRRSFSRERD